jgi:hypothetical protein
MYRYMAVFTMWGGGGGSVVKFEDIKDTEVVLLILRFWSFFTYLGIVVLLVLIVRDGKRQ